MMAPETAAERQPRRSGSNTALERGIDNGARAQAGPCQIRATGSDGGKAGGIAAAYGLAGISEPAHAGSLGHDNDTARADDDAIAYGGVPDASPGRLDKSGTKRLPRREPPAANSAADLRRSAGATAEAAANAGCAHRATTEPAAAHPATHPAAATHSAAAKATAAAETAPAATPAAAMLRVGGGCQCCSK